MFLRFSKGQFKNNNERLFRKCVFLGDSLVMEYGDKIVCVAKLHKETETFCDYDIIVAKNCELCGAKIARYVKDMIGKSNKFTQNPSTKRRKYYVEMVDCDALPIKATITITRN